MISYKRARKILLMMKEGEWMWQKEHWTKSGNPGLDLIVALT